MSQMDAPTYSAVINGTKATRQDIANAKSAILTAQAEGLNAAATRREAIATATRGDIAATLADLRARLPDARLSGIDRVNALFNGAFKTEFFWRGVTTISVSSGSFIINLPGSVDWSRARLDYQVCPGIYMSSYPGVASGAAAHFSCYVEPINATQLRATVTGIPWVRVSGEVGCWPVVTWHIQQLFL